MTKEVLEMIKTAVKESEKKDKEEILKLAHKTYLNVWEDILRQYKNDSRKDFYKSNIFLIYVQNMPTDKQDYIHNVLTIKLIQDGFEILEKDGVIEYYTITRSKIIAFSNQEAEKQQIIKIHPRKKSK